MGVAAIAFPPKSHGDQSLQMREYLSSEGGYWLKEDKWYMGAASFDKAGIKVPEGNWLLADFSVFRSVNLKTEMKYYYLSAMKKKWTTANSMYRRYGRAVKSMGECLGTYRVESFKGLDTSWVPNGLTETEYTVYRSLYRNAVSFITDYYGESGETEKDVWRAVRVPGARLSATTRSQKPSLNFQEIPCCYREMVKRFTARLVIKRSWSYCTEMVVYIRYFFKAFYAHGYTDGFFEKVNRKDMEQYLVWVAGDYGDKNATFRSKAVTFIRQFIDYIQLAEYEQAPLKDVTRLLFDDDVPRRERPEDTMSKIKYIPAPVKEQLDAGLQELEPPEMRPVYVLLRESGWRGTDVLNLRYHNCLDYVWSGKEKRYIPYLCGEITKTGIPLLKIPIRTEVGDMVKKLVEEVKEQSTQENNPGNYLFNAYEGKHMGLPYSKPAFSKAVQELIAKKGILDGDGTLYHFKAHSLRHTRAQEYTEQGMPIGMIQQVLGHCSLQMTLHYSKVTENMLYEKWKETEKLNLLHLDSSPPQKWEGQEEGLHYEYIRKNLDAVKVPFGVCFKPSKLPCRQQMNHCITCANFCTCGDHVPEYEAEIERVRKQLELSKKLGRNEWEEKNQNYLEILEKMLCRVKADEVIHKNGKLREDSDGR